MGKLRRSFTFMAQRQLFSCTHHRFYSSLNSFNWVNNFQPSLWCSIKPCFSSGQTTDNACLLKFMLFRNNPYGNFFLLPQHLQIRKNAHAVCTDFLEEAMDSIGRVKDLLGQPLQAGQDEDRCYSKKWLSDYKYYSYNRKSSLITKWFWFFTDELALHMKPQSLDFFSNQAHTQKSW